MEPAARRRVPAVVPPPRLLLLLVTLLACATTTTGWSVCESANCGKGHCGEVPGLFPSYKCECDPGWSQVFDLVPISPCIIPKCDYDKSCFNLSLTPPRGIPITDICVAVNCGPGGTCKTGSAPFTFTCECHTGWVNMLNLTSFPCIKPCFFGPGCAALGLAPLPTPPPAPAPPDNDSSGAPPAAPPRPGPKGSVSLQNRLQLLLLVSMAAMSQVL